MILRKSVASVHRIHLVYHRLFVLSAAVVNQFYVSTVNSSRGAIYCPLNLLRNSVSSISWLYCPNTIKVQSSDLKVILSLLEIHSMWKWVETTKVEKVAGLSGQLQANFLVNDVDQTTNQLIEKILIRLANSKGNHQLQPCLIIKVQQGMPNNCWGLTEKAVNLRYKQRQITIC